MAPVDVSVILVSWNTQDLVLACLESLPAAFGTVRADVWVVDNASSDMTLEMVRSRFPEVHLIENRHNVGFAAANNQAIAASQGRYVLLLNSDTVAHPGSIEQLVRFADSHPQAGVVGPMLLNPDGSFQDSFARFPSLANEFLSVTGIGRRLISRTYPGFDVRHAQVARRVDYVSGACMLVRRAAIAEVGVMDELYFMYSEEIDWCYRIRKAGWEIWFTPEAQIVHYGGQSTRQWRSAMIRALYRSKVRFFRLHYGHLQATLLQALFFTALRLKWFTTLWRSNEDIGAPISWSELGETGLSVALDRLQQPQQTT
ncbi:MAG: glycosyltransferase family 2 protein [Chloroflexaceae bacterium]|nr:glycosyltransferase family 2 protein [Chloroflexaceae bacterium]